MEGEGWAGCLNVTGSEVSGDKGQEEGGFEMSGSNNRYHEGKKHITTIFRCKQANYELFLRCNLNYSAI